MTNTYHLANIDTHPLLGGQLYYRCYHVERDGSEWAYSHSAGPSESLNSREVFIIVNMARTAEMSMLMLQGKVKQYRAENIGNLLRKELESLLV